MMDRKGFLAALGVLPLVPGVLWRAEESDGVELPERYDAYVRESFTDVANSVIEPNSGGLRVRKAWIEVLKPTGDAKKSVIHAVGEDGHHYEKVVVLSGAVLAASGWAGLHSEMAYQATKRVREIAHDMAAREWGPEWRKKVDEYRRPRQP